MDPWTIISEIQHLLTDSFPETPFQRFRKKDDVDYRYLFIFTDKKKDLSILVYLPIRDKAKGGLEIHKKKIIITIERRSYKNPKTLVKFRNTVLSGDWKDVLKEKISIVLRLLDEVPKCDNCNAIMLPRSYPKKDKTKTLFVSFCCSRCGKYKNTEFGTGLKRDLHRIILNKDEK